MGHEDEANCRMDPPDVSTHETATGIFSVYESLRVAKAVRGLTARGTISSEETSLDTKQVLRGIKLYGPSPSRLLMLSPGFDVAF